MIKLLLSIVLFLNFTLSVYSKIDFEPLQNTLLSVGDSCPPISTISCNDIEVSYPVNLTFNGHVANTIADKNGSGTGFTMVNSYSATRLAVDGQASNSDVPGYEPSKITLNNGRLELVSNKGISYLTNNNQLNSLGVRIDSRTKYQVEVSLINPFMGSAAQQAGLWLGINDKTFLKLVVVGNKVELRKEINDVSSTISGTANPDLRVTGSINGLNTSTVRLRLIVDPATNTAEAYYSTDGAIYRNVGSAYPQAAINIENAGFTGSTVYAGIYCTHRNASTPVTYTFDDFKIIDPTSSPCSPLSNLPCANLQVNLPYNLPFDESIPNTIVDKNSGGTGFTLVNTFSGIRLAADGNISDNNIPGYEASKLKLTNGTLEIVSNKGISYLKNNNQLNALGVKFDSREKFVVATTIVNPFNGSAAQQAGIWLGPDDKTFFKLVVVGNKIEFKREINDVSSTSTSTSSPDTRITGIISNLNTKTVYLRIFVDPSNNTAEAFYSFDGINFINVGESYPVKTLSISGMGLTSSTTYAGIFTTHRNSSSPVTYTFSNFSIRPVSLIFSAETFNFTVIKGKPVKPQNTVLRSNYGSPAITLNKTSAEWLTLPNPQLGTITLDSSNINTNLAPGLYKANIIATADGYQTANLLINLTVIEPPPFDIIRVNFQDNATIPPPGMLKDFGQPFGLRTGQYQGLNKRYGWKSRSDSTLLDLTKNGRNRQNPEDVALSTLIHMQADDITGTFNGTKIEGFWETELRNGEYDVTVSVGDALTGQVNESHSLNVEGVSAIQNFVPEGVKGSFTRFKSSTVKVTVSDGALTINADGGFNTKINNVKIVPISIAPYLFWASSTKNILIENGTETTPEFIIGIENSIDSSETYNISATYGEGATDWLSFNVTHESSNPTLTINYSGAKNLPIGIYKATIKATALGYEEASFNIQLQVVDANRPYVISSTPFNGQTNVKVNTVSIAANQLYVPAVTGYKGGVDNSTITNNSVKLFKVIDENEINIPGVVQGTGGGDAISFSPSFSLEEFTTYKFKITDSVKSYSRTSFAPFETTFTTGALPIDSTNIFNVKFEKIPIPGTQNKQYSSLVFGPDGKFYALRLDGAIERFTVDHTNGELTQLEVLNKLLTKYGERTAVGLTFDPSSTATNLKAWVSHSSAGLNAAPAFDGNISVLTGANLENEELVITKLPRSTRDHLTNSIAFGPDGALYFCQGSNSSMGEYDGSWQRAETLLSGTVLRLDLSKMSGIILPLNVQTTDNKTLINNAPTNSLWMSDGTYNPYSSASPLTIYASGVRNAFDLIWHSNGQLYIPANGSGGGGNTPASVLGTRRPDGTFYNGPDIPRTNNVQVQNDWLFRINPLKGVGYFGHPNPLRGEYVANRGYTDNPLYPSTVIPDINYRSPAYNFGLNHSPNGVIEYKNAAFNNQLKGKLIVCRFSGGGDLTILEPGSMVKDPNINSALSDDRIYNIIASATGSGNNGLEGMSGFVNPLDVVEDTITGNLYVSEFNWNNNPQLISQITLLKAIENSSSSSLTINRISLNKPDPETDKKQALSAESSQVMKVYPNPNPGDKLYVALENYEKNETVTIYIYNMSGRLIQTLKTLTDEEGKLNVEIPLKEAWSMNYYIIKVHSGSTIKQSKFFIQ